MSYQPPTPAQRAQLEAERAELEPQIVEAQFYRCGDGQLVNLAVFGRRQDSLPTYPEADRPRILEAYSHYRRISGKLGSIRRKLGVRTPGRDKRERNALDERQAEIIELCTRLTTAKQVHAYLVTRLGLEDISYAQVLRFQEQHQQAIKERQQAARADITDLPLVHQRGRLEILHDLLHDREQRYQQTHNREDYRLLLATLEQIRKEIDGEKLQLTVDGRIDVSVEQTIHQHMHAQWLRDLNPLLIVITRLAAQRDLDPSWMMAKLQRGYYAAHNGLLNPHTAKLGTTVRWPSEETYDFEAIKAQHQTAQGQPLPAPAPPSLEAARPSAPAAGPSLKDMLLARLAGAQRPAEQG